MVLGSHRLFAFELQSTRSRKSRCQHSGKAFLRDAGCNSGVVPFLDAPRHPVVLNLSGACPRSERAIESRSFHMPLI